MIFFIITLLSRQFLRAPSDPTVEIAPEQEEEELAHLKPDPGQEDDLEKMSEETKVVT
jgi:hypothetical protein